jgi:hypothetical protein
MHLSVVGVLLVLFVQLSTDSWTVEASCSSGTTVSGSITDGEGSHLIEVFVTYHVPGSAVWLRVPGASQTLSVEGPGPHSFGPLDVSATPAEANAIRVEIEVDGDPTNEKSESFPPCAGPSPTPTHTSTSTQPTSTSTQPTPTSTSQPTSTATQPPPTSTSQPTSTATQPVSTATQIASLVTATLPAAPTSQIAGVAATPTATPAVSIRGIPNAGDGGLLAEHRTSLTVLGIGLIFFGMALVATRGLVDGRRG